MYFSVQKVKNIPTVVNKEATKTIVRWDKTKKQEFKTQLACNSHSIDVLITGISIALQNEYISRYTVDSIMDKLKRVMLYSAAKCGMVKTIKCGGCD